MHECSAEIAVLSVQMILLFALTRVSVSRSRSGSGVSFAIGIMTAPFAQHIENSGFSIFDFARCSSFQWRAPHLVQLNVSKMYEKRNTLYSLDLENEQHPSKGQEVDVQVNVLCRWAGCRLIGSGNGGGGGPARAMGLLRSRCGESDKMLFAFRISARRWVRGVIGGCIDCVGGVLDGGTSA